ncbi:unnamed protein product [Chrysoparadoxa australica]
MLIKGYKVVEVPLSGGGGVRYLYLKEHSGGGNTLFVANVDDAGGILDEAFIDQDLRELFGGCGKVESVRVGEVKAGQEGKRARGAHVTFSSSKSLKRALELSRLEAPAPARAGKCTGGLEWAVKRYKEARPSLQSLTEQVDKCVGEWEASNAAKTQEAAKGVGEPDEDGFVTVTYKRKRKGGASGPVGRASEVQKKKKLELKDFYRFQMREEKREQLARLREKFEEDKARVAKLKLARKFKPF